MSINREENPLLKALRIIGSFSNAGAATTAASAQTSDMLNRNPGRVTTNILPDTPSTTPFTSRLTPLKNTTPDVNNPGFFTSIFQNYFDQGLQFAQQGPTNPQMLVEDLETGEVSAPDKGDVQSWDWNSAVKSKIFEAMLGQQLGATGLFDTPEYALHGLYGKYSTLGYLESLLGEKQTELEKSLKADDADKLFQSNLESTRGAWEQLEAEKNNPHTFDPMYGYAMMEYLQGDRSDPFNFDQWDYEYQSLTPDQQKTRLAELEKQWKGLDFDALTGRNYSYESATPGLQSNVEKLQKEIERRKALAEMEAMLRSNPDYDSLSVWQDDYVAPEKGSFEYIFSDEAMVQGLDDQRRFINAESTWGDRNLAAEYSAKVKNYLDMGLDMMTPAEVASYNVAYSISPEQAAAYLELLAPELNARRADVQASYYSTRAGDYLAGAIDSAGSIITKPQGTFNTIWGALTGEDDPNAAIYDIARNAGITRGEYGELMGKLAPIQIFGEEAGTIGYNVLMSIGDMLMARGIGGMFGGLSSKAGAAQKVMGWTMASESGASTYLSDLQNGKDPMYAALHGVANGAIEMWSESGFIDSLFDDSGRFLTRVAKSATAEGLEEVVSEGGQMGVDLFLSYLTGQENEIQQVYKYYEQTLGKGKAAQATLEHFANNFGVAFLSGYAAGGGTSVVANTATEVENRATGKAIMNEGDAQRLLEIAKTMDENSDVYKTATEIETTTGKGKKMPLGKLGRMTKQLNEELNQQYSDVTNRVMEEQIAARLEELGTSADVARRNAVGIRKMAFGEKVTIPERAAMAWDDNSSQVTQEIVRGMNETNPAEMERTGKKWVHDAKAAQIDATGEVLGKQFRLHGAMTTKKGDAAKNVSTTVATAVQNSAGKVRKDKDGKAAGKLTSRKVYYDDGTVTGEGDIKRFEETEDGKLQMVIEGKDGEVKADIGSFTQSDGEGTAGLLESIKDINENLHKVSAEEASAMLKSYELAGGDVARFVESYETLYLRGYSGGTDLNETLPKTDLDGTLANIAVEAGKRQAEADEQTRLQRASEYRALENPVAGWLGEVHSNADVRGLGDADALSEALEAMPESQRTAAEVMIETGKAVGLNVVLFDSSKADMGTIKNGSFDEMTHTVYYDVNAWAGSKEGIEARKAEGTLGYAMLLVGGHELTHYLEAGSPEMYAKYKAAVKNALRAKGQDIALLIREKIDRALNSGRKMSYKAAEAEVIADASEYMLRDSKFTNDLDPTLKGKIKTFIQHFAQKMKEIFNHLAGGHKESAALMETVDGVKKYMKELQDLWDAGFDEILAKGTTEQAGTGSETAQEAVEGVRFSDRDDYLLDGSEYGRFRRNWESRKTNHFTKRTNGGVLIDMGNLLVYTDRKGNPQHVLEVMTEDLWEENDIVQRAILLETGGYDKDEQQEILGRIFPEGSFRFRIPGDRSSNRGQNGRGSKRDVGKVRREDREEQSFEGASPEFQVKRYSDRDLPDSITVREYLSGLKPTSRMNETEKILLKRYQEKLAQLEEKEKQVSEQEEIIRTAPFRNPDGSLNDEITKAKNRYKIYRDQANRLTRELLNYERDEGFAGILATGRQVVQELTMGSAGGIADAADALETEVAELTARLTRLEAEVTRTSAGQRNAYARGLYDPKVLNEAAKQLKDTYGSRMSVKSIADRLALTFGELYASEGTEGARLFTASAKELAEDLLKGNKFRYKSEILPMLQEKIGAISLTETDVQEIENRGYTLREYKAMLSPYIKVSTGGSDLSSVASNANYFGDGELAAVLEDETEGTLAMRLYEVISREKAREAEIAYEGMTEGQLIGMAMADIAGANLPMSANNQTVDYLRKELMKYAGENADVAIAVEEAIGKAKTTTAKAGKVWREAVKHTETARQAVEYYRKLEEQRRVLELADQKKTLTEQLRSDNAQKLKEKVEAQKAEYREREQKAREYRKSRVELDKVRKRISRNVKTINALRVRETDKKHVPQQLQVAADLLMQTFTDTNLGRLAFPQAKLDSLSRTYRLLLNEEADATHYWDDEIEADIENLRALSEAYEGLKSKKDGAPSVFTLEGVEYETEILRGVDNVVANILNMIDAWNDNFLRSRTETFEDFANQTGEQLRAHEDHKTLKGWKGKVQNVLDESIRTGNMTPVYFFDHLHNQELLDVFNEIREGMRKAAMIEREGKEYIEKARANRNYGKWVADGRLKMKTGNGHIIELTREEACEIYAIAKREKANKLYQTEHLLYGGFQYKHRDQHVSEDGKTLVQDVPNQLDAADLEKIGNWLTAEQKAYADDLVGFLSTTMADYGNEASMDMYGYEKFTESYYIPFRTVAEQRYLRGDEGPQGENAGTGRLLNSGFTKKLQHKANATLYVGGISETVAEHIHKMAAYSAMVQPIENLKRLLNHKVLENDGTTNTLRALIGQKYGKAAENYMTQLLKDLNGATQSDQRAAELPDKLVGAFKRGAVMASASVVLQQPTAMARAMAMISPKYFAQNPFYRPSKGTWEKMLKHSGTAIIKDMGKFDVGMGKTASQYILDEDLSVAETYQRLAAEGKTKAGKAALDRFINWLTAAPGVADQWTWGLIWKAAEDEQAALHPKMDRNSDEFLDMVGKRFDEVVDHTQVYDSVLTKSNLMRSQNGFHKMATAFMAEPTLSINMLYDALTGKHGKKQAARIIGSVAASQVLAGALAALVQAWNDDDDERNWLEKYADRASSNIFSNINVFGMIPYVSDIVSLFEGYDVERPDLSVIADVMDYTKKYFKGFADGGIPSWKDTENFVGTLANLVGIPAKNISREIRRTRNAILNTDWSAPSAFNLGQVISENTIFNSGKNTEYYQRIVTAELRGETERADNLRNYMLTSKMVTEDKLKSGIKTALKEAFIDGETDEDTAIDMLMKIGAYDDRDEAYWEVDKWKYMQETGASADSYGKYSDFFSAVESGKDLKATIQIYLDNGVSKSTLASKITSQYKPQLIALKQSGKGYADLQARILTAYEALGYDRDKKLKDIQKWFE